MTQELTASQENTEAFDFYRPIGQDALLSQPYSPTSPQFVSYPHDHYPTSHHDHYGHHMGYHQPWHHYHPHPHHHYHPWYYHHHYNPWAGHYPYG
jgi:hypothetical protein